MSTIPEIECPSCDGHGSLGSVDGEAVDCLACKGAGWRPMTPDELDAAAERQAEDRAAAFHDGGGPLTMDEQHRAAWAQKERMRR